MTRDFEKFNYSVIDRDKGIGTANKTKGGVFFRERAMYIYFIKRRGNNPQKYIVKKDRKQTSTPEVPRKTETIEIGDKKG